ncbi:MAG: aminotransferase class I/II-fold pyridoxal phosphate-dependent enzyme [Actinobacteria bacterium]|nr:aminotransferase class I/II-fold pyridoxal phosphate-dependent enzyme [Actinomycetota bacterium]
MPDSVVNLYSDTQTRPSAAMREAMASAEVADEQRGHDPTVNALQDEVAALLGQEAALFAPSGSMCNQIAIRLHIRPLGDEMYAHRLAHTVNAEAGGAATIAGAMVMALEGEGGMFDGAALRARMRDPLDTHEPRSRLVTVEQPTNLGGGRVWPLAQIEEVLDVAREFGLRSHLDGARLLNATVASGESAAAYAGGFDTAWIDFSKGLGAPVGACLAGSAELIEEARRYKQMLGGSMRQGGIVAAAARYGLQHNVERLAEDHANARFLAEGLAGIEGVEIDPTTVETNIVIFDVADPVALHDKLAAAGVEMSLLEGRVRAVTHLDVDRAGVERALAAVKDAIA